jgi:hypothetical protein
MASDAPKKVAANNLWYIFDYWFWLNIAIKYKIKILTEKLTAYRGLLQNLKNLLLEL